MSLAMPPRVQAPATSCWACCAAACDSGRGCCWRQFCYEAFRAIFSSSCQTLLLSRPRHLNLPAHPRGQHGHLETQFSRSIWGSSGALMLTYHT
jgi:hypothetical protein